jgi:hypothetical protein
VKLMLQDPDPLESVMVQGCATLSPLTVTLPLGVPPLPLTLTDTVTA